MAVLGGMVAINAILAIIGGLAFVFFIFGWLMTVTSEPKKRKRRTFRQWMDDTNYQTQFDLQAKLTWLDYKRRNDLPDYLIMTPQFIEENREHIETMARIHCEHRY